jgi:hypothetical protein
MSGVAYGEVDPRLKGTPRERGQETQDWAPEMT